MAETIFQPIYQVVGIIIVGGLFGGLAAYTVAARQVKPGDGALGRAAFWEFILLGVIASACVPLFLSLLKSGLLDDLFPKLADDKVTVVQPAFGAYLIFIGLCLIAAFSARRFIDTVSAQVFQRLEKVDARVEEADTKASRAVKTAETAKEVARETAEEVESADNLNAPLEDLEIAESIVPIEDEDASRVSADERKILQAMAKKTYRTRSGIAEDSGISRNRISELLEDLADRKLALPTTSPRTGGARWIITNRGRAAIGTPA